MGASGIFAFSSLLLLASLAGAQDKPPAKGSITGTVVNSVTGEPLSKVEISAEEWATEGGGHVPFATTDARGKFTLGDLTPGQYRLKGRRNGYLETHYGARSTEAGGTPITLDAGQDLKDLQFKLVPYGVIAGTVRDQDGEPLATISVEAHRLKYGPGGRKDWSSSGADTNDLGEYRIIGLEPGRYLLRAEPDWTDSRRAQTRQPLEILVPSIYPGVQDPAGARSIQVDAGARVTGIDLVLPRRATVPVSGHVTVAAGTKLDRLMVNYPNSDDAGLSFEMQARVEANGDFDFPAVPAGAWAITATASPPQKPANNMFDLMFYRSEFRASVPLQVGDVPVRNVQIAVEAGAEVAGRITLESGAEGKIGASFVSFHRGSGGPSAQIHDDLTFSTSLGPGHYVMDRVMGGFIVHSITSDGRNILDDGLTVSSGGKIPVEIVLGRDGGQIDGVVLDKEGKHIGGATVVLVPEARLRTQESLFRECKTDQNGHYEIKAIPPGDYKLFAWEDVEPGSWWDDDFLREYEEKGEVVSVKPSGKYSTELHLVLR